MTIIMLVFLLAGVIKGVIGLGLPTISMGLLTVVMTPASAAGLLIIPSLVTNIWQLASGPALLPLINRLWPLLAGIVVGTFCSILPGLTHAASWTEAAMGGILILYGITGLLGKTYPVPGKYERWLAPLMGYITGAITAATGVFVIPAVPWLQALQLAKNQLVQALGLAFTVSTVALAMLLFTAREAQQFDYSLSALALLPALVGMHLGQYLRHIISEQIFRRIFFSGLIALGLYMILS